MSEEFKAGDYAIVHGARRWPFFSYSPLDSFLYAEGRLAKVINSAYLDDKDKLVLALDKNEFAIFNVDELTKIDSNNLCNLAQAYQKAISRLESVECPIRSPIIAMRDKRPTIDEYEKGQERRKEFQDWKRRMRKLEGNDKCIRALSCLS